MQKVKLPSFEKTWTRIITYFSGPYFFFQKTVFKNKQNKRFCIVYCSSFAWQCARAFCVLSVMV